MKWLMGSLILIGCLYGASSTLIGDLRGDSLSALSVFSGINPKTTELTILEHYQLTTPGFVPITQGEKNYTLTTSLTHINEDESEDIIAILNSEETCGTGGCLASIFLQNEIHEFEALNFAYTVKGIEPLDTYTNGMRDLRVNHDESYRLVWNGSEYTLEETN